MQKYNININSEKRKKLHHSIKKIFILKKEVYTYPSLLSWQYTEQYADVFLITKAEYRSSQTNL